MHENAIDAIAAATALKTIIGFPGIAQSSLGRAQAFAFVGFSTFYHCGITVVNQLITDGRYFLTDVVLPGYPLRVPIVSSSPFSGRRERKVDSTRARIFRAAIGEFRRVGFAKASVSRIAREAGVSRPTFYAHYPTKDHVLLELEWLEERTLVEQVQRARSLAEALDEFTEGLVEVEAKLGDSDLFRDMFRVYARGPADLPLEEQPYPIVAAIGRHFREGAERGELRAGLEPGAATRTCLLSVFGHLSGPSRTAEERRADFALLFSLYLAEAEATKP